MGKITAILLAGTLKPSTLRHGIGMPIVCLPMGSRGTLLDAWLRALAPLDGLCDIRVVVNDRSDAAAVEASLRRSHSRAHPAPQVRPEPAAWRGAAGIIRDVTIGLPAESMVLVAEATCLPPTSLESLTAVMEPGVCGAVAIAGRDQPAGAYLLTRAAIETVPERGYCDLKEQLLPSLAAAGTRICPARIGDRVHRVRDRESYLSAVRYLDRNGQGQIASDALISESAVLDGNVIVAAEAVIEDGAVVHDSVILEGAVVGGGAVVSQSVVGPHASVSPRTHCVREVVPSVRTAAPHPRQMIREVTGMRPRLRRVREG